MYEKVNPCHPDKVADRIAGAIVDLAYQQTENPKMAAEVLLGHGHCTIIAETSIGLDRTSVENIVKRLAGKQSIKLIIVPQDIILANNQENAIHCGDNGIFKGVPVSNEQYKLTHIARGIYGMYPTDGKYIINNGHLTICQSCAKTETLKEAYPGHTINPLGDWTGGSNVDAGCTNRKLGSDMGDGVTGGGLHGKDLSKADVSANIWCHLRAQETGRVVTAWCAIGDENLHTSEGDIPYSEVVKTAKKYIEYRGGFEKFAEWGLIY